MNKRISNLHLIKFTNMCAGGKPTISKDRKNVQSEGEGKKIETKEEPKEMFKQCVYVFSLILRDVK